MHVGNGAGCGPSVPLRVLGLSVLSVCLSCQQIPDLLVPLLPEQGCRVVGGSVIFWRAFLGSASLTGERVNAVSPQPMEIRLQDLCSSRAAAAVLLPAGGGQRSGLSLFSNVENVPGLSGVTVWG